jgi:diacylglycerol kinase family enzyme
VLLKPQSLRLKATIDGRNIELKSPAVIISNNIYEDSMWLRPKTLDEGVLGFYAVSPMSKLELIRLGLDLLGGRWRDNMNVQEEHARSVRIEKYRRLGGKSQRITASIDGETVLLPLPLKVEILAQSLKVLVPRESEA